MSKSHKPLIDFREYIQKRRITDSRQGDFTASAKVDPNLPDARNWEELEDYLYSHFILRSEAMFSAAKLVWQQYRSQYPAYMYRN